jgi:hypothetical protein
MRNSGAIVPTIEIDGRARRNKRQAAGIGDAGSCAERPKQFAFGIEP